MVRSGATIPFADNKSEGNPPWLDSGVRMEVESFRQASKDGSPCIQKVDNKY